MKAIATWNKKWNHNDLYLLGTNFIKKTHIFSFLKLHWLLFQILSLNSQSTINIILVFRRCMSFEEEIQYFSSKL